MLLPEIEEIVANAEWDNLTIARKRILGEPNNLKENLFGAAASLTDLAQANKARVSALERRRRRRSVFCCRRTTCMSDPIHPVLQELAQLIIEYVTQADYIACA